MIWFVGYLIGALITWVIATRVVYVEFFHVDGWETGLEDKAASVLVGGGLALIWPISLAAVAVYRAAFGQQKGTGDGRPD